MRRYVKIVITIILSVVFFASYAQDTYTDGYAITNAQDTIYGKIRNEFSMPYSHYPNKLKYPSKINMIKDDGEIIDLFSYDIIKYSIDSSGYITINLDLNNRIFARILVDGEVKLLSLKKKYVNPSSGIYKYTGTENDIESSTESHVKQKYKGRKYLYDTTTKKVQKVDRIDFRYDMERYFSKNDILVKKIQKKNLRHRDMSVIVSEYNVFLEDKSNN